MPHAEIASIALFACLYSAAAGRIERTPINGALVFVAFGFACGPFGFGLISGERDVAGLRLIAELALALVLFSEATKADLKVIFRTLQMPRRLVFLALPLVILLGFVLGLVVLDGFSLLGLAILATILAPTDAALGKAVITNKQVPADIREGLNFESGLNDGICVPIFLALLALVGGAADAGFTDNTVKLIVQEIGIGAVVGLLVSYVAALTLRFCHRRGWFTDSWMQVSVVAAALACSSFAMAMHGSGFIGAFVGGLLFGYLTDEAKHELILAAEGTADALTMVTWIIFGVGVVGQVAGAFSPQILLYAVLSLTVIRIVPVLIALQPLRLTMRDRLFVGWFGPRGLATVVFSMMVLQSQLPEAELLVVTAACTVLLSVILHGLSAVPVIHRLYGSPANEPAEKPGAGTA